MSVNEARLILFGSGEQESYPSYDGDIVEREVAKYPQLNLSTVRALIDTESAGNPEAVSHKGAIGTMQLMPGTARNVAATMGDRYDDSKLRDPKYNLRWGIKYFADQMDRYGDERLALTANHAGPSGADAVLENYRRTGRFEIPRTRRFWDGKVDAMGNPIPGTGMYTADYVQKILGGRAAQPQSKVAAASNILGFDKPVERQVSRPAPEVHRWNVERPAIDRDSQEIAGVSRPRRITGEPSGLMVRSVVDQEEPREVPKREPENLKAFAPGGIGEPPEETKEAIQGTFLGESAGRVLRGAGAALGGLKPAEYDSTDKEQKQKVDKGREISNRLFNLQSEVKYLAHTGNKKELDRANENLANYRERLRPEDVEALHFYRSVETQADEREKPEERMVREGTERAAVALEERAEEIAPLKNRIEDITERVERISGDNRSLWRSARSGQLDFDIAQAIGVTGVLEGDKESADKLIEQQKRLQEVEGRDRSDSYVVETLHGVAAMLPPMLSTAAKTAVPGIGSAWGTYEWSLQGAGDVYSAAREAGVSHETARSVAPVVGLAYALVEKAQVARIGNLGKGVMRKRMRGALVDLIKSKGVDWGYEVAQEGAQRLITDLGTELAQRLDGVSEKSLKEVLQMGWDGIKEEVGAAAGPMGILSLFGLGGGAIKASRGVRKLQRADRLKEVVAKAEGLEREFGPAEELSQEAREVRERVQREQQDRGGPKARAVRGDPQRFKELAEKAGITDNERLDTFMGSSREAQERATEELNDKEFEEFTDMALAGMRIYDVPVEGKSKAVEAKQEPEGEAKEEEADTRRTQTRKGGEGGELQAEAVKVPQKPVEAPETKQPVSPVAGPESVSKSKTDTKAGPEVATERSPEEIRADFEAEPEEVEVGSVVEEEADALLPSQRIGLQEEPVRSEKRRQYTYELGREKGKFSVAPDRDQVEAKRVFRSATDQLGLDGGDDAVVVVSPDTKTEKQTARIIERVSGRKVKFFSPATDIANEMPYGLEAGGTIYLNTDNPHPYLSTGFHEIWESYKRDHGDLVEPLIEYAEQNLTDTGKQRVDQYAKNARLTRREALKENLFDVVADDMSRPDWWKQLHQNSPNAFRALVRKIQQFVDKVVVGARKGTFARGDLFRDASDLRNQVQSVYNRVQMRRKVSDRDANLLARIGSVVPRGVTKQRRTKITQPDMFGGKELTPEQQAAEGKKKAERAEGKRRQEETKGGRADMAGLPMFEDQDIEGSQQTLQFQRREFFYSPTLRTIEAIKQERGVVPKIQSMRKKGQLKKAETEWMGLDQYLADNPQATKTDVLDFLRDNQVRVDVVEKGTIPKKEGSLAAKKMGTKFDNYNPFKGAETELTNEAKERLAQLDYKSEVFGLTEEEQDELRQLEEDARDRGGVAGEPFGANPREINLVMPAESTGAGREARLKELEARREEILRMPTTPDKVGDERARQLHNVETQIRLAKEVPDQAIGYRVPSAHQYGDEADVNRIAHARTWDVDYKGDKTLAIGEIQSDWARDARKKGVVPADKDKLEQRRLEIESKGRDATPEEKREWADIKNKLEPAGKGIQPIADFPFKKNWDELALKKAISVAANEGYDRIVFANGEQTADLYNLSKQVSGITAVISDNGKYRITADENYLGEFTVEQLPGVVGKDLAQKMVDDLIPVGREKIDGWDYEDEWLTQPDKEWGVKRDDNDQYYVASVETGEANSNERHGDLSDALAEAVLANGGDDVEASVTRNMAVPQPAKSYHGNDLKVEPLWAKNLYDKRIPSILKKLIRKNKWNTELEEIDIGAENGPNVSMEITPEMAEQVQSEGLPMFQRRMENATHEERGDAMYQHAKEQGAKVSDRGMRATEDHEDIMPAVPEETLRDKFIQTVQDKYHRLKVLQEFKGKELPESLDALLSVEIWQGKAEYRLDTFERKHVKPLMNAIYRSRIPMEKLDEYLYAKHAKERNAHIWKINPRFRKKGIPGSGMSNSEANEILRKAKEEGLTEKLEGLSQRVYAMLKEGRDLRKEAGLLDEQTLKNWEQYDHYVPLYGIGKEEPRRAKSGRGYDVGGEESKRALGRTSKAANIIANAIVDVNGAIVRAEKNRVGQTFLRFVQENPDDRLWTVDNPGQKQVYDKRSGEVVMRPVSNFPLPDNVMRVKVDGKEHFITIKDPTLANAMKNLDAQKMNILLRTVGRFSRWISMVNTALSPGFIPTNYARDIQTAIVNTAGEDISTKEAMKQAKDIVKNTRKAMVGAWKGQHDGKGEWADWYREYAEQGGKIGFMGLQDVETTRKKIERELRESKRTPVGIASKVYRGTGDMIMDINGAVENSIRLSTYVALRKRGASKAKAARAAKNITVNFNKHGEWGPAINALYAFSNAGIQGTARLMKAMKSRRVQGMAGSIVVASASFALLNRIMGGEDDDGIDYWDKVPDWEKRNHFIFMIPGGKGRRIKIPVPYGYNVFWAVGQSLETGINDPSKAGQAAVSVAAAIGDAFNPFGGAFRPRSIVQTFSPTAIRPIVDVKINENFFGGPIYPEDRGYGPQKAMAERSFRRTSEVSKTIARFLNRVTGGTTYQSGWMDFSPDVMDYTVEQITGSMGATLNRTVDALAKVATNKPVNVRNIPVVRRFYGEVNDYATEQMFWDRVEKAEAVYADMKELRKTDFKEAVEFAKRNREDLRAYELSKSVRKQLKYLRTLRDKAESTNPKQVDKVKERMQQLMKRYLKATGAKR